MPESKARKTAPAKTQPSKAAEPEVAAKKKLRAPSNRQWVPPTFITVGLVGVLWLVTYYVSVAATITIPYLTDLAGWNVLIGMGLMAAAFGIATLWK